MEIKEFNKKSHCLSITGKINDEMAKGVYEYFNNIYIEDRDIHNANIQAIHQVYKNVPYITQDFPEVLINLNSPGGTVYYGLSVYDSIKGATKTYDTKIICNGLVASVATIVLMSVPVDKRVCTQNTTFIIHQVSGGVIGTGKELEDEAAECQRLTNLMFKILTENTKITKKRLDEVYEKKQDWIITAQEALELGIIGKICD